MRRWITTVGLAAAALALAVPPAAVRARERGDDRPRLSTFATLPESSFVPGPGLDPLPLGHPEGLTADKRGNIYAATFDAGFPNFIHVFGRDGRLRTTTPLAAPPPGAPLPRAALGMVTARDRLFVNDVLYGDVLEYELPLAAGSVPVAVHDVCGGFVVAFGVGAPETFCALNAIDVGPDGRLYMSDNGTGANVAFPGSPAFPNGRILVLDRLGNAAVFFDEDAAGELDVAGFPPFGVNGIAFAPDGKALYMVNMSTDAVYELTVRCRPLCEPRGFRLFAQGMGIDGPDNIDFDGRGRLWIASGQNNSVVGLDRHGRVVARIGSFQGFTPAGAPRGLLQPSGLVVSRGKIYVGNEASQGLYAGPPVDWSQLKLFTIARIDIDAPTADDEDDE